QPSPGQRHRGWAAAPADDRGIGVRPGREAVRGWWPDRRASQRRAGHGQPVGPAGHQRPRAQLPAGPAPAPGSGPAPSPSGQRRGGHHRRHRVPDRRGQRDTPGDPVLDSQSWLPTPHGRGHLAPHSDPGALPGDVLIADHRNNRLIIVDPQGRIRWQFPRPGDLARGQTFLVPDDAFFSPDGKYIIATQEDDQVISVINVAAHRIVYRYGTPGVPGAGPNHLSNPDDALILPGGSILAADIRNCRIVLARPPAHHLQRTIGQAGGYCWHDPPARFGSPNGAFPMTSGR